MDGDEWGKLLLGEIRDLRNDVQRAREEIAALKVKASVWGALSGFLAGLGTWFASNK